MEMAEAAASRASCDRLHVGCVLVKDKRVISTGYNGSMRGAPTCDEVGHDMVDGHCVRTIHAERNALCNAAKHGVSTDGATSIQNYFPCFECFKHLVQAGILAIVFKWYYGKAQWSSKSEDKVYKEAKELGITIRQWS